ncbi:MAG: pilus assembly protein TadG-related protein, partial [Nitrospirales bacterium]
MSCLWFKNQRGSVLLFSIIMLMPLLVIGAIAMDLGYVGSVRREMQRSMDAAALAGAGNLGFDDTVFPATRAAAQNYAALNGYSHYDPLVGDITLDLNPTNLPTGDIVLGVWEDGAFAPSLDGTVVNAVQCQFEAPIPTSFLSMLALDNLTVSASAIAVSNPPEVIPDGTCVFPIAVSCCSFGGCTSGTSSGCGAPITFITSARPQGTDCIAPPCPNSAAWADPCSDDQPNTPTLINLINA